MKATEIDGAILMAPVFEHVHEVLVQRGFERGDVAEVPYTVWLCMRIDGESKNGGFSQLFYNLRGRVPVEEMTAALERIGSSEGAALVAKVDQWLTPARKKKLYSSGYWDAPAKLLQQMQRFNDPWYAIEPEVPELVASYLHAHRGDPAIQAVVARTDFRVPEPGDWGTWLHSACQMRSPAFVKRLLEAGADPNALGWNEEPPTFLLVGSQSPSPSQVACMQLLLDHGADPNAIGKDGCLLTCSERSKGCVETLLRAGADPNGRGGTWNGTLAHVLASAYAGVPRDPIGEVLEVYLAADPDLTLSSDFGSILACVGDFEIAEAFLAAGAPVDPPLDEDGLAPWAAIHSSAERGKVEWLRFWLHKGADPNSRLDRARITSDYRVPAGSTALDIARGRRHRDCRKILEAAGAGPGERAHWTVVVMSCDSNESALYGAIPDGVRIVESGRSRAKYLFDDDPIRHGVALADHLRRDEADAVVERLKAVGAVCELV